MLFAYLLVDKLNDELNPLGAPSLSDPISWFLLLAIVWHSHPEKQWLIPQQFDKTNIFQIANWVAIVTDLQMDLQLLYLFQKTIDNPISYITSISSIFSIQSGFNNQT